MAADWRNVDWSLRNVEIAEQLGVSRERARQMRSTLGRQAPAASRRRAIWQARKIADIVRWMKENAVAVPQFSIAEIKAACGVRISSGCIRIAAERAGVVFKKMRLSGVTQQVIQGCVSVRAESGCWEWLGSRDDAGYGKCGGDYAHRQAYRVFKGKIPDGLCVLHHCDNPPCVNPDHLYAGTDQDNSNDRVRRGRARNGTLGRIGV